MKKLLNIVATAIVACLCMGNLYAQDVNTVSRYIPYPEYTPEAQRTPCTPVVTGPADNCQLTYQASCNGGAAGWLGTFTITNFSGTWANYSFIIAPGSFNLTPFGFTGSAPYQFSVCFPNNWDHYYININDVSCASGTGKTMIEVAACCSALTFLQNPSATTLPNTILSGFIWANFQTYLIEGTLTIDADLILNTCSLKMKEGSEIIVQSGKLLTIATTSIDAACDMLWKGITVQNGGKLRIVGAGTGAVINTRIRDAQYAVKIEDDAEYDFDSAPNLERNWVCLYFPDVNPTNSVSGNMHLITPFGGSTGQSFNTVGTQIQGGISQVKLFPDYPGQTPATVNHNSKAAIELNDVSNFSFFNAGATYQTELGFDQNGIIAFNSNIDLTKFWIKYMKHVVPPTGTPLVHSYGIFAEGSSGTARNMNLYWSNGFGSFFDGCDTSVFSNQYMDCNLDLIGFNTYYLNGNYPKAQRHFYHSGANRTVTVKRCQFNLADYNVWINNIQNGTVDIEDNYFANPVPYTQQGTAWTGSFKNSCIIIKGNPNTNALGQVNLKIKNNTFVGMRIGMHLYNIDGGLFSDGIKENHYYIADNVYTPGQTLYHQPHYGYMAERCANLTFESNEAKNLSAAPPLTYTNWLADAIAFNIKTCGSSVLAGSGMNIISSNIDRMGTCFRFIDNCTDVGLYCNGMNDSHRGVYYDFANAGAYFSSQGAAPFMGAGGGSNSNQWQNWSATNRVEGTLNINALVDWYYNNSNAVIAALEMPNPHPVLGGSFSDIPLNSPNIFPACTVPQPMPPPQQRIAEIINGAAEYVIYPDESKERDKEAVYNLLKHDVALRNSNIDFLNFYNSKAGSNYDKFKDVNNFVSNGDYTNAINLLVSIVPDNTLEEKMKFALGIGLQLEQNPSFEIPANDKQILFDLAWTPVWEGGDAVFIARSILNLEVNDYGNGLRKAQTDKPETKTSIYPNPTTDKLFISVEGFDKFNVTVADIAGRKLLEQKNVTTFVDVSKLSGGIYIVEIKNENNIISTSKITKQ